MRFLVLVTDAFGGRGGIAKFNQDLLVALCNYPGCDEVVALPRAVPDQIPLLPPRLSYWIAAASGKAAYVFFCIASAVSGPFEAVICGHLNLLPLAAGIARLCRAPLVLVIYGVEAWRPRKGWMSHRSLAAVHSVVAISDFTKERFLSWNSIPRESVHIVPCCIDVGAFGPAPRRADLLARYGLAERTVLLTVARLSMEDRYKGVDEILELLPTLARERPDITYLVVGDGDDRARMEAKATTLGVREHVVFAGYIPESEKADHYRLADVFVMPGRGEGFGIVYLEALACGVPVIASSADASGEAVRGGLLGQIVNPDRPAELRAAILQALDSGSRGVPEGLDFFSLDRFRQRWHRVMERVIPGSPTGRAVTS